MRTGRVRIMQRPLWIPWRWWRRAAQLALLAVFFWIFRRTEYQPARTSLPAAKTCSFDSIRWPARPPCWRRPTDGLRCFGRRWWSWGMTLLLGRFFCGWICPLGTLLDYFHRILRLLGDG